MDCIPSDIEEKLNLYLSIFNSDSPSIKLLPYYLIPLASSLYYYLHEKKRSNQYISASSNDQKIELTSSFNEIFDYEFEALVASSISAITLSYLNINTFNPSNSFKKNMENNINYDINIFLKEQRLELYKNEKLTKDKIFNYMNNESTNKIQLKRNIQILAEFRNVLSIISNIMQILKLTDNHQEFQWLSTMHHYIYEEAYHAIILQIKDDSKPRINNIKSLFKNLFFIKNNNDVNFISYLNKNYCRVLRAIRYNRYNTLNPFRIGKKIHLNPFNIEEKYIY